MIKKRSPNIIYVEFLLCEKISKQTNIKNKKQNSNSEHFSKFKIKVFNFQIIQNKKKTKQIERMKCECVMTV